jgi:hypothetical protein
MQHFNEFCNDDDRVIVTVAKRSVAPPSSSHRDVRRGGGGDDDDDDAGYRDMLSIYLLNSLSDRYHGYIFLFGLFMAGLVGIVEKSGGFAGITNVLQRFVGASRSAQGTSFFPGLASSLMIILVVWLQVHPCDHYQTPALS